MHITPEEAAHSLAQIRRTQHRALRSAPPLFPSWYLVAVWVFVAGIQLVTEVTPPWVLWIGVPVLAIGLAVAVVKLVVDIRNQSLRPHASVVDPWAWAGMVGWIVVTTLGSIVLTFGLQVLEVDHPRTIMGAIMVAVVAASAPVLTRWMSWRTARRAAQGAR
ncbi:hypothetical protein [Nonomuraea jiangxiensis]|uniref:Transmembrane protein n=1 Tax=Nonomuraea jiangxiensis TaxID=633440 RepID=A0A1G9E0Z4_9ACTN|nr:hypothetical protein [Nonomuraea jiangxiensis]SDK69772.1 hypothetical protein SAMN05421869_1184 [Nonomuraea jiangxiensis]